MKGPKRTSSEATGIAWNCPGCGAEVTLPSVDGPAGNCAERMDSLAQAVCGCWVKKLSDEGIGRLLGAIMTGYEVGPGLDLKASERTSQVPQFATSTVRSQPRLASATPWRTLSSSAGR